MIFKIIVNIMKNNPKLLNLALVAFPKTFALLGQIILSNNTVYFLSSLEGQYLLYISCFIVFGQNFSNSIQLLYNESTSGQFSLYTLGPAGWFCVHFETYCCSVFMEQICTKVRTVPSLIIISAILVLPGYLVMKEEQKHVQLLQIMQFLKMQKILKQLLK